MKDNKANPMDNFARTTPAARRRAGHAFLGGVCVAVALGATGCSGLGFGSGSPESRLAEGTASQNEVDAALAQARAQMDMAPAEPYWPYRMGQLYAAADSLTNAVVYLQAARDRDPDYAPAVSLMSKLQYNAGSHNQAVVMLEDYVARNPDAPDAVRAALALHLEAIGDVERAEAVLNECGDDSREVRTARTFVSLRGDDLASVLDTARRALDANPNSAANLNNYGIALLYAGQPREAREAFEQALKIDKTLPGALYNMAIVETFYFFDEDKGREWFERYKQHASADPDDLESVFSADVSVRLKPEAPE
jgi:tetratricopeptide (TPR) repeat protein